MHEVSMEDVNSMYVKASLRIISMEDMVESAYVFNNMGYIN